VLKRDEHGYHEAVFDTSGKISYRRVMAKKSKYKVHLEVAFTPTAACGIIYPTMHTLLLKFITCKRCKASYEYRANKEAETDIAFEEGSDDKD